MISDADFRKIVARAALAPSVHNVQPARWRLDRDTIYLYADLSVSLDVGDPTGADAGLSCGAALEATLLALGDIGLVADVIDCLREGSVDDGYQLMAKLALRPGEPDPIAAQLERRFTWRDEFEASSITLPPQTDVVYVTDSYDRTWIAKRNDWASLEIMKQSPFRHELLGWMRLSEGHPRYHRDGLSREAMQMPKRDAMLVRWALGPLWPILHLFGATRGMTAEANKTTTAPLIACFHRPVGESVLTSGRAYLRLCLEASKAGAAGWPMAALSDHPVTRQEISERFEIGPERRLVQVIRFGKPTGKMPPRARRPVEELIL